MVLAADDATLPWTMCEWSAAGVLPVWSCVTGCTAVECAIAQVNAGVPYVLLGGTPFWGRTEVKDVVAYLRLAVNLDDVTGAPPLLSHNIVACHGCWQGSFDSCSWNCWRCPTDGASLVSVSWHELTFPRHML
jgi:hypothetical protein